MKFTLGRLTTLAICFPWLCASGCVNALDDTAMIDRSKTPFVVEYSLAPGAKNKSGVQALTNTGARTFAS